MFVELEVLVSDSDKCRTMMIESVKAKYENEKENEGVLC